MRTLNIPLDDKAFKKLERAKNRIGCSWAVFLQTLIKSYERQI